MSKRDRIKEISARRVRSWRSNIGAGGAFKFKLQSRQKEQERETTASREKKKTKALENCHQETFEMKAHPYLEAKPQSIKKKNIDKQKVRF